MKVVRYVTICVTLLFCLTNTQCEDDDCCTPNPFFCEESVIIDDDLFNNAESADFTIMNIAIEGDCMVIEYSSSGCDASTWIAKVYGSTDYVSTSPVISRLVKLNLQNDEACLAVFTETISFELINLQVEETASIIINIEGWEDELFYEY